MLSFRASPNLALCAKLHIFAEHHVPYLAKIIICGVYSLIQLKRASIKDAEIILDINIKAFNDEMQKVLGRHGGPPGYDNLEEHKRLIDRFLVYLVKADERTIGSFFLVPHTDNHYSLESFCIYPKYQGNGYGYETLKVIEQNHPNVKKWSLGAFKKSLRIQKLYEKFGYTKIDENEWEIMYEKKLQ